VWIIIGVIAVVVLAHTAPVPFLFDLAVGKRAAWHMPKTTPPTIYFTFDDGPNPTTTGDLLDVLAREGVRATFFLIDRHITDQTVPLVRRMFEEGHAVAVHSHTRAWMLMSSDEFARTVTGISDHIERVAGHRPCAAFRPHAGWRTWPMYRGLKKIDYRMIGWSWMLWDWNWFRARTADSVVKRIGGRAGNGDIIVLHDGDQSAPLKDQRHTVDAAARLIPMFKSRGFAFGALCLTTAGG
jgi:peptidoglycan/xylan/chitin deacetylase (PgdA/CDA1 family)